jgi:hypothetical protein
MNHRRTAFLTFLAFSREWFMRSVYEDATSPMSVVSTKGRNHIETILTTHGSRLNETADK